MMVKQAVYNKSLSNSMFNCVFKAANSSEEGRYFSDDNPFGQDVLLLHAVGHAVGASMKRTALSQNILSGRFRLTLSPSA